MRPSFLDHLSAAEACRGPGRNSRGARNPGCARAGRRSRDIGHEMSRRYVLEHPVDDPDEDEDENTDDDFDEDDEDDEDADEEDVETWQCRS